MIPHPTDERAYGHAIYAGTDPEVLEACVEVAGKHCTNGVRCPGVQEITRIWRGADGITRTTRHRAGADATHYALYWYRAGRDKRPSRRDIYYCPACAGRWAAAHGLRLPLSLPAAPGNDTAPVGGGGRLGSRSGGSDVASTNLGVTSVASKENVLL